MSFQNSVTNFLKSFLTVLILTVAVILFILICVPVYGFRFLIKRLSKYIHPDFGEMLTPQSTVMAIDAMYTKPECAYVIKFLLNGEISIKDLEDRLEKGVAMKKYHPMTCSLQKLFGFYFWKRQSDFQIKNRIAVKDDLVTLGDLREIHKSLVETPFQRNQPLWECIVYSNIKSQTDGDTDTNGKKTTAVFFRVHQALADGTSFLQMFSELNLQPEHQGMVNSFMKMQGNKDAVTTKQKFKFGFQVATKGSHELVRNWVETLFSGEKKKFSFPLRNEKKDRTKVVHEVCLKGARRIAMSSLAPAGGLMISLITGAERKRLISKLGTDEDLPSSLSLNVNCPIPIPFPTDQISNYVSYVPIESPYGADEPLTRLGKFMGTSASMIMSPTPYIFYGLIYLVGGLVSGLVSVLVKQVPLGSVILNTFPGSNMRKQFLEREITEMTVKSGCPSALGAVASFDTILYRGDLHLNMTYPENMEFKENILEEYEKCESQGGNNKAFGFALGELMKNIKPDLLKSANDMMTSKK